MSSDGVVREIEARPYAPGPRLARSRELELEGQNEAALIQALWAVENAKANPDFPVPNKLECYDQMVNICLKFGLIHIAETVAIDALNTGASNPHLYCRLAQAYLAQSRVSEAKVVNGYALQIDPMLPAALKLQQRLSEI